MMRTHRPSSDLDLLHQQLPWQASSKAPTASMEATWIDGWLQAAKQAQPLTCSGKATIVKSIFGGRPVAPPPGLAFPQTPCAPDLIGPDPPELLFIFLTPCSPLSTRERFVALSRPHSGAARRDIGDAGCRRSAEVEHPHRAEGRAVGRTTRPEADTIPPWSVARHKNPTVACSSARWVRRRIGGCAPPSADAAIASVVIDGGFSASAEPTQSRQTRRSLSVSRELPSEPGAARIFCGSQTLTPPSFSTAVTVSRRSLKDSNAVAVEKST